MICKNCGAAFDDALPKCPYCGEFSYAGAEKEYLGRLENMKEDLDELHETVPQMYHGELKKQAKRTGKIFLIIFAVLGVGALLIFGAIALKNSLYDYNPKEQLLFSREAYPIADEYYNAGDYEGLLEFYYHSIEENPDGSFYDWEHYPFLICYEYYSFFQASAALIGTEEFSADDMTEIFFCYLASEETQRTYSRDENDKKMIASYIEKMRAVIDSMNLPEDLLEEFYALLNGADYFSWKDVEKVAKKAYQELY